MSARRSKQNRLASLRNRPNGLEHLESRTLLAGDLALSGHTVIISEIVADSTATLLTRTRESTADAFDGQADSPDWLELFNTTRQAVDLSGMHLTDDATRLDKWTFPVGTSIDAGGFLVVFASGEDIADPALDEQGRLHTNFRLSSDGDYVALTDQASQVVHEFTPSYPQQRVDVSYAVAMQERQLLGANGPLEYLVPNSTTADPAWRDAGFNDPALQGTSGDHVGPIGFDLSTAQTPAEAGETVGLEPIKRASSDFSQGSIVVLQSSPFTAPGRVDRWSFYSEVSRTLTPLVFRSGSDGEYQIVGVGQTRTSDGSGAQSFDFELQSGTDLVDDSGYFFGFKDGDNDTNVAGVVRWASSTADEVRRYNGPQSGNMVAGNDLSGGRTFGRAYSLQATTKARLGGPFNTDVATAMNGANSLYVRYPFQANQLDTLRSLTLRIRYEDGFVAYLNGQEVARRNAPLAPRFDSAASTGQPLSQANQYEDINVTAGLNYLNNGENVLAIHALNEAATPELVIDAQLIGIEMPDAVPFGYSVTTTPMELNGPLATGLAVAPEFSHDRGIYREAFSLGLISSDPAATIYYTLDGSTPSNDNPAAIVYAAPVPIDKTTIVRAITYADGQLPSTITTATYVFPTDVVNQAGMNTTVTEDAVWGPLMVDSLNALPTISLVTNQQLETIGEIGTSIELLYPDGRQGFQVDAGVEVYGGTAVAFPKQSLRISFKNIYGPTSLEYDLFDDPSGITDFDQFLLRAGSHDTPFFTGSIGVGSYVRNKWMTDRQLEMGHAAPRSRFVHVYLNGNYIGQFDLMERPNASFAASTWGGESEDYDAINAGKIVDGDLDAWNTLLASVGQGYDTVKQYLDIDSYVDYVLLEFFGGNNIDWGDQTNWMATRKRDPDEGFHFYAWDSDIVLRSGLNVDIVNYGGPGLLLNRDGGVTQYPEFRELLAKRAYELFTGDGLLTPARLRTQIDDLAAQMRLSVLAETARWGSGRYTPATWESAIEWIKTTYASETGKSRADVVLEQMQQAGLIPIAQTPSFESNGVAILDEHVTPGAELEMLANGDVYYTLDGSDPRLSLPRFNDTTLIDESTTVKYFLPTDASLGKNWTLPGFDDTTWPSGPNGIGYDTSGELSSLIQTDVSELMNTVNSTLYTRTTFEISDPSAVDQLDLGIRYDDGFVAYLNGVEVARRNAPSPPVWNSRSSLPHDNVESRVYERFDLTRVRDLLIPGENVLAIHAMNLDPANNDFLISVALESHTLIDAGIAAAAIKANGSLLVPADTVINARTLVAGQWSPLRSVHSFGVIPALRIAEIMYHPSESTAAEIAAGFDDEDEFEFIELVNIGTSPVDLSTIRFVQVEVDGKEVGVAFDFATSSIQSVAPGGRVLVVENEEAFRLRYGVDLPVAGQWSGGLSNDTEHVQLNNGPITIQQLTYHDHWWPTTDGDGYSLEMLDVTNPDLAAWSWRNNWRPSDRSNGTPGLARRTIPGDVNHDGIFNSADLVAIFQAGEYEDDIEDNSSWEEGDWNGDGDFTTADLVYAFQAGTYTIGAVVASTRAQITAERHAMTESDIDELFGTDLIGGALDDVATVAANSR
ncbi:MAG: lamin tail domain-containing protein [Planctomycetales bacterium]|nr:lamin tail domain-containing protein [Planctomycetales bacterium]